MCGDKFLWYRKYGLVFHWYLRLYNLFLRILIKYQLFRARVTLLADLVVKRQGKWSNTGQILIKYSSNIEQILIKYWSNTDENRSNTDQILVKKVRASPNTDQNTDQIFIKNWSNTDRVLIEKGSSKSKYLQKLSKKL